MRGYRAEDIVTVHYENENLTRLFFKVRNSKEKLKLDPPNEKLRKEII